MIEPVMAPVSHEPDPELLALEQHLWQTLAEAAATRGHAWRTPVLATVDAQGVPDARTVVLREVQANARELVFYTDARAPKVAQLMARPQAAMVMWSPELGWQLRLSLDCQIETSGLAVLSRWTRLKMTPAAHDYLSPLPPGSALSGSASAPKVREHFAVVTARVVRMDWLSLDRDGHRRACFAAGQAPQWLQP